MKNILLFFILTSLLLFSCKKEDDSVSQDFSASIEGTQWRASISSAILTDYGTIKTMSITEKDTSNPSNLSVLLRYENNDWTCTNIQLYNKTTGETYSFPNSIPASWNIGLTITTFDQASAIITGSFSGTLVKDGEFMDDSIVISNGRVSMNYRVSSITPE